MNICCDICGGELVMLAGGKGAVCKNCGMEHSIERVREMLGISFENTQKFEAEKVNDDTSKKVNAYNEEQVEEIAAKVCEEEVFDIDEFEIVSEEVVETDDSEVEEIDDNEIEYDEDLTESSESDFVVKKGFFNARLIGYNGNADRVIFPKNIIEVSGEGIFSERNEIVELVFLGGITTTEGREFANLKNLKRIICNGAMLVMPETFAGCENLEEVHIITENDGDNVQLCDGAFSGCEKLKVFSVDKKCIMELYNDVFKNCKSLKKFVYPRRMECFGEEEGIKSGTFENCTSLETVVMPDEPICIHKHAFKNCTSLKKVTYSDGRKFDGVGVEIHPEAFKNSSWQI